MNPKAAKKMGRFLSLILRHKPETIGITLDDNGWADVKTLLEKLNKKSNALTFEDLTYIVENNNKKRYAFNEDKTKIRASQGHSIDIKLGYQPVEPPTMLYHGTATRFIDSIKKTGLEKRSRQHVHLSADLETAKSVGRRHGKLVILEVAANQMFKEGFDFFLSENKVWLTDNVPVKYIQFPD